MALQSFLSTTISRSGFLQGNYSRLKYIDPDSHPGHLMGVGGNEVIISLQVGQSGSRIKERESTLFYGLWQEWGKVLTESGRQSAISNQQ